MRLTERRPLGAWPARIHCPGLPRLSALAIGACAVAIGLGACGSDSGSPKASSGPCIAPAQGGADPICGDRAKDVCRHEPGISQRCVEAGLQKDPNAGEVATATPNAGAESPPASNSASFGSPDFVISVKGPGGDAAQVLGHFGRATTLGGSDADQEALAGCAGAANSRAMVARLDLRATVTSSLAARVELSNFNSDSAYSVYPMEFLMGYSDGPECGDGGLGQVVDLGELEPSVPHDFTLWVLFDDAITPNDPSPSQATLGKHTLMRIPTVLLGGATYTYGADPDIRVGGPRVIQCAGKTISAAGTVPKQLASSGTGHLLPCRPTAAPAIAD